MNKTIEVQGYSFEMIMIYEMDGYFTTDRRYELFYKGKKIAENVGSIKSCYNEAYSYVLRLQNKP